MATSTLLQLLDSTYGDGTTKIGLTASNRRQVETFIASGPIAANDLVCLDFAQAGDGDKGLYIKKADGGSGATVAAIGFAISPAAAGDSCQVAVAGIHEKANVDGATAQGNRLIVGATAGRAAIYTAADTVPIIAYACEADTANVATVFVIKQF